MNEFIYTIPAAMLGLSFYEAIRIYKGGQVGKKAIPDFGYSDRINLFIYIFILVVFISVSIFFSIAIFSGTPQEAFLLGFSVPSGANLLQMKPQPLPDKDFSDDHASDYYGVKLGFFDQLVHAYKIFYM